MKTRQISLASAIAISAIFGVSAANANVINFSGSDVNMGTVSSGQSGTITNGTISSSAGAGSTFQTGSDYGFLAADSEITISYTFSGLTAGALYGNGSYNFTTGTGPAAITYSGNAASYSGSGSSATGTANGVSSTPLVFASANLNPALTNGTVTIVNNSTSVSSIQALFSGLFASNGKIVSETYNVSSVPLPASFPMFAAAIAGIAGLAMTRKRRSL